jgi:hypothetical protein
LYEGKHVENILSNQQNNILLEVWEAKNALIFSEIRGAKVPFVHALFVFNHA